MAKTVTQGFKDVWGRKAGKRAVLKVRYKRRYWNGSAYVYEASWIDLNARDFQEVGEIAWSLDTPFQNVFKTTDVTLRLDNLNNQWIATLNSPSIFAADSVAGDGYEPVLTKFQIQFGYQLTDGSIEYVSLFTGLATDYVFEGSDGAVEVVVTSNARLLEASDASKVSDVFTNEATVPAAADGVTTVFETTSVGVGYVAPVRVDAIVQKQGTDYTISQLNSPGKPARITFETAPVVGAIDASGIKWKTNKKIDELVALLCDEAGIGAGDRTIEAVTFPAGLAGFKKINLQTEWDNGTKLDNIDYWRDVHSIRGPWKIYDNFNDGDLTALRGNSWNVGVGSSSLWTNTGNRLKGTYTAGTPNTRGRIATSSITYGADLAYGMWIAKIEVSGSSSGASPTYADWRFIQPTSAVTLQGYSLYFDFAANQVSLAYNIGGAYTTIINCGAIPSGEHTWRIRRKANGEFKVWKDGVALGTGTHTTVTSSVAHGVEIFVGLGNVTIYLDELYDADTLDAGDPDNITGLFESEVFDLLVAPIAWGVLQYVQTLNGGAVAYKTAVADAAGGPYDAWTALGGGDVIQSSLKRYLKIQAAVSSANLDVAATLPKIDKIVANFTVDIAFVSLAIFTGKTCYDAIQRYAKISDYEMGFDGDGIFFFRARPSGSSVITINQENAIAEISDYHPGYDRVINVGQVQYAQYFNEYDGADAGEASPTSEERFGRLISYEDLSDVLLANDVDLASGRAQLIRDRNYRAKRRFRIKAKLIAWLDLSDVLTVDYYDHPLLKAIIWGDYLQPWGKPVPAFGEAANVLARLLDVKAVGLTMRPDDHVCDIIVEEKL